MAETAAPLPLVCGNDTVAQGERSMGFMNEAESRLL